MLYHQTSIDVTVHFAKSNLGARQRDQFSFMELHPIDERYQRYHSTNDCSVQGWPLMAWLPLPSVSSLLLQVLK